MNNLNSLLNHHNHPQFDEDFLHQMLSSVTSPASSFPWPDDQITARAMMLQHPLLRSHDAGDRNDSSFEPDAIPENDGSIKALFDGFPGSLGQNPNQPQHFDHPQVQADNFGVSAVAPAASQPSAAGQPRQRVRARRGQATDPHSIAERLRRERIAERMKALQELVPNAVRTDKASMLDEIIDYVKFLQLQVKVLSTSRLGGAAAVAPLLGDLSDQGNNGNGETAEGITAAEKQVVKLLEEDMGSAMQYLQGKGLCLMPISLGTSTKTSA